MRDSGSRKGRQETRRGAEARFVRPFLVRMFHGKGRLRLRGCRRTGMMGRMANGLTYSRKVASVEAMKQLAATLAPYVHPGDAVVLSGDLGAGKTQFVQGVATALGVRDAVCSPTFNILLTYPEARVPLYHFDLYRLDDDEQLDDIGFYETVEGDGVSFVEWGDKFLQAMPYNYLDVRISANADESRTVRIHAIGDRARQLLYVWANDSKSRLVKC